jgi:uncharacterized protein YaeQ
MALKATVFKAELQVSDLDRGYYASHALTVARHPSETDERMLLRLLAFALYADAALQFTRGISSSGEPDLWQHAPDGTLELWIELGHPDERRLRQACGRARRVVVISYGDRAAGPWWAQLAGRVAALERLSVLHVPAAAVAELAALAERNMPLQVTIDSGVAWVSGRTTTVEVVPERWQGG